MPTTTTTTTINIGDLVIVNEEQVPEDWARQGEVAEFDGQAYIVELEDGHRCEVLPDQLRLLDVTDEPAEVTLVNLTPHKVNIHHGGQVTTLEPAGPAPRCSTTVTDAGTVAGIPVTRTVYGDVEGLPQSRPNVYLIVSRLVAERCPDRTDLLIPGPAVRNTEGAPIGCRGLSRL